ncbi:MAG: bifunctional hydroxymethylpyrimidine kinase/phosphomethylpyrimidine kinase [Hydrogenophaga sp.]|uniref:bifunctional hydroxymethylpyrimidine kinase/phosphomethylpyrimidine kinase n=1 Tax=Hydrogenophaga sp. TaxID=1904254 RepID=UPI00260473F6|nr:bifunctional hydroxymethylpyrimidine kinase/phosphomethylpyrimidine kinase [Hydrogenophaga sp.]MCV0440292.1 bifunctional hydroxymethylpyrimidine kinase/phosphomethylpyrimidine kinase [Hydrogenophaga sp.]
MRGMTNESQRYTRILSIAGSDSGGGAGIQADLKTFAALGCYGMTAITALTAQNTLGVSAIHGVPPEMLKAQLCAVFDDIGVDAVKIGMLHAPDIVRTVAWALKHYKVQRVVLDPVMVATSGDQLITPMTVQVLVDELFPLATVVTPNLDEAALLLSRPIEAAHELETAARDLLAMGAPGVLLKGGHLPGDEVADLLVTGSGLSRRLASPRIASRNTHGTGCTLSSAIAAHLALGERLEQAVVLARDYILRAIAEGADVYTGGGHGPLNHGFAPVAQIKKPPVSPSAPPP